MPTNPWEVQGAWTPQSFDELKGYAAASGFSEDYARNNPSDFGYMMQFWDPNQRMFRSEKKDEQGNYLEGWVEKPNETPEGWSAWGDYAIRSDDPRMGQGGGGSWGSGGGSGGWGGSSSGGWGAGGGVPQFNWTRFDAPKPEDVLNDPSYQFRLAEGNKAIEGSAAAKGLLRTGGTLKDIAGYGQDLASQEYGNMFNRALQGWGANYQGEKDAFAPQYGSWETMYGGDLSRWTTGQNAALQKYLQREGNIYGLLNPSMPAY